MIDSPVTNSLVAFDFHKEQVTCLICLQQTDPLNFHVILGKHYGRIAEWNDANGKELTLWQSMINRPNFWVEGCLALRSSLENRTSNY